ncbi:MAG: tetratricopeptide repeat protein, partial [Planctomycetota bacterium]
VGVMMLMSVIGKTEEAVTLLGEHFGKTRSPVLGGLLGEFAFREGKYAQAAEGLALRADRDVDAAKALALCYQRRGLVKEAEASLAKIVAQDPEARVWAAGVEVGMNRLEAATKLLEGVEGDSATLLRLWIAGRQGDAETAAKLGAEKARDGSRGGEDWLLPLLCSKVLKQGGGPVRAANEALTQARFEAGKRGVAAAKAKSR